MLAGPSLPDVACPPSPLSPQFAHRASRVDRAPELGSRAFPSLRHLAIWKDLAVRPPACGPRGPSPGGIARPATLSSVASPPCGARPCGLDSGAPSAAAPQRHYLVAMFRTVELDPSGAYIACVYPQRTLRRAWDRERKLAPPGDERAAPPRPSSAVRRGPH